MYAAQVLALALFVLLIAAIALYQRSLISEKLDNLRLCKKIEDLTRAHNIQRIEIRYLKGGSECCQLHFVDSEELARFLANPANLEKISGDQSNRVIEIRSQPFKKDGPYLFPGDNPTGEGIRTWHIGQKYSIMFKQPKPDGRDRVLQFSEHKKR